MAKLSLVEITQSQLASTPIVSGQLVVATDTGNLYRDVGTHRIPVAQDVAIVTELPLAPLENKMYLLNLSKLYIYSSEWILLSDFDSLQSEIEMIENNLFSGYVALPLVTDTGDVLVTSDGDELFADSSYSNDNSEQIKLLQNQIISLQKSLRDAITALNTLMVNKNTIIDSDISNLQNSDTALSNRISVVENLNILTYS